MAGDYRQGPRDGFPSPGRCLALNRGLWPISGSVFYGTYILGPFGWFWRLPVQSGFRASSRVGRLGDCEPMAVTGMTVIGSSDLSQNDLSGDSA